MGSYHYAFTLNNPTEDDYEQLSWVGDYEDRIQYLIFQLEMGENETVHFQGYVQLKSRTRVTTLKRMISERAHFEVARGSDKQNYDYCTKQDSRLEEPIEFGQRKPMSGIRGRNNILESLIQKIHDEKKQIKDIIKDDTSYAATYSRFRNGILDIQNWTLSEDVKHLDIIENEWISGPTGTGKSHYVMKHYPGYYDKLLNKWWDGYKGEDVILLDDVTPTSFKELQQLLRRWCDKYTVHVEVKGGSMKVRPKKIVVTSNYKLEDMFKKDEEGNIIDKVEYDVFARRFPIQIPWTEYCKCDICS